MMEESASGRKKRALTWFSCILEDSVRTACCHHDYPSDSSPVSAREETRPNRVRSESLASRCKNRWRHWSVNSSFVSLARCGRHFLLFLRLCSLRGKLTPLGTKYSSIIAPEQMRESSYVEEGRIRRLSSMMAFKYRRCLIEISLMSSSEWNASRTSWFSFASLEGFLQR